MTRLSVDYAGLVCGLRMPLAPADLGTALLFPLSPDPDGTLVDRGQLIPHLSGGEFGPNIFRQRRDLNRGWSSQGKRFRALEREVAAVSPSPGSWRPG